MNRFLLVSIEVDKLYPFYHLHHPDHLHTIHIHTLLRYYASVITTVIAPEALGSP
jgi:hypothetical protein